MSLQFVKTAVLTSTDGLDFSKEEAIESDEAKATRLAQERAANKPLYQQLAEQKDKKQQEYDAMTKMIFAPPKAIDEEEAGFLKSLYKGNEDTERRKKEEEERQLESFRAHRKTAGTSAPAKETKSIFILQSASSSYKAPISAPKGVTTIKAVKRKQPTNEDIPKAAKQKVEPHTHTYSTEQSHPSASQSNKLNSAEGTGMSSLDMLGGYGSSSEDEP